LGIAISSSFFLLPYEDPHDVARVGDGARVRLGRARGYSAAGDFKTALKHAEIALTQAPDASNRKSVEDAVARLKQGHDMNAAR
jgi:hypothetical protein